MLFRFLSGFFILLTAHSAQALIIQDERGQVQLDLPSRWKYEKNLMGLPHVLLSPEGKDRASFSITLTGLAEMKLPTKELEKNQPEYQEGRKKWAESRGFKVIKFIPYALLKSGNKFQTHSIGFQYRDEKSEYTEMSYFTECPNSLVHTKALGESLSPNLTEALKIVKSLMCL